MRVHVVADDGRLARILEAAGDDPALAQATLYQGAILALAEDPEAAGAVLRRAGALDAVTA